MRERGLLLLRRATMLLKKIPGFIFLLEPVRKSFSRRKDLIRVNNFDGCLSMVLRLDEHMQSQVFWYGYYSRDIILLLDRLLKPGMTVLDVGANIGEISLAAARRLGPSGYVFSFEPMPQLYSRLNEHISMNAMSWIIPISKGLSDKKAMLPIYAANSTFNDGTQHDGLGTLYPTEFRSSVVGDIELLTMDEFCIDHKLNAIDLVKIDVEGAELAVLMGGKLSIEKFKPFLIVEIQADTAHSAGYQPEDIISMLKTFGYTFFVIGRKARLRPLNEAGYESFQNVLCVPHGASVP